MKYYWMSGLHYMMSDLSASNDIPMLSVPHFLFGEKIKVTAPNPLIVEAFDIKKREEPGVMVNGNNMVLVNPIVPKILQEFGITNYETFSATLRDSKWGREWNEYLAFNVLGTIDVANMEESEYNAYTDFGRTTYHFRKMVFSEKKLAANRLKMFRAQYDDNSFIYVTEDVFRKFSECDPPEALSGGSVMGKKLKIVFKEQIII